MAYQDTKVYYDGSHYIAIPKRPAPRHPGARLPEDLVEVVDEEHRRQGLFAVRFQRRVKAIFCAFFQVKGKSKGALRS